MALTEPSISLDTHALCMYISVSLSHHIASLYIHTFLVESQITIHNPQSTIHKPKNPMFSLGTEVRQLAATPYLAICPSQTKAG